MPYQSDEAPWPHTVSRVHLRLKTAGNFPRQPRFIHRFQRIGRKRDIFAHEQHANLVATLRHDYLRAWYQKDVTTAQRINSLMEFVAVRDLTNAQHRNEIREHLNELNRQHLAEHES